MSPPSERAAQRTALKRISLVFCTAIGLLVLPGCDDVTIPPNPNAFDRPESVAFFCWDLNAGVPVALEECTPAAATAGEEDVGEPREGYALHALVTQTSNGEVAAVRMTGRSGEAGIIDSDVRIPGFTFAPVGEVPSALAISRSDPKHVFVANRGSSDIRVIAVADFRKGLGTPVQTYDGLLPEGSRPSDMILTPDESALLIALPTQAQIARVLILDDGVLGAVELLDLQADIPAPVDLSVLSQDQLPPVYEYLCANPPLLTPEPIAPREPVMVSNTPEPWSLLVDDETGQVLVADRSLPLIHVIDPVALTEGAPLSVSVPTRALTITPRVPATFEDTEPTERFLYAIDEIDRSVLAIDYTDPARGSFGGVLTVNVVAPQDRLAAPFPARAIAVMHPNYSDEGPVSTCVDAAGGESANGLDLEGVFLGIGDVNGRVRFYDIFDLDAPCRGASCAPTSANPNAEDQVVSIGRHRPRFGSVRSDTGVEVDPAPVWNTSGAGTVSVDTAGQTTAADRVPTLEPVTCVAPLDNVFPAGADEALICALRDPWAAISERFSIVYEAPLPNTSSGGGNFDGDRLESRTDYCALGVLGSLDAPSDGPLAGYLGDMVAITQDLPQSILDGDEMIRDDCEALTQRTSAGEITPLLIEIERAFTSPDDLRETYVGRLQLGEILQPSTGEFTLDDVRTCYPELLEIEIRAREAFVVGSTISGFNHPIVRGADGACVVDTAIDDTQRGRAFFGETFSTPVVTFAFGARPPTLTTPSLEFAMSNVPAPLTVDVSAVGTTGSGASLVTRLFYNDVDQRLYVVDQSVQGLLRLRLTPALTVQQTFR